VAETSSESRTRAVAVSELPDDELISYGRELGLSLDPKMGRGQLLRLVRERQELLLELDRDAMLDVVVWARIPVRKSAHKEELARKIAGIKKMDFRGLSDRGLTVLARLRGVPVRSTDPRSLIEARLRDAEPLWDRLRRARRRWVGDLISMVVGEPAGQEEAYRFLPESNGPSSLKEQIVEQGVVGGIAHRLRSVADDYVREKMDEIEARIDRKLDEIDARLAEWRDKEIANRLRIIKITLVVSVLVALLSLGYNLVKRVTAPEPTVPSQIQHGSSRASPCDFESRWI